VCAIIIFLILFQEIEELQTQLTKSVEQAEIAEKENRGTKIASASLFM